MEGLNCSKFDTSKLSKILSEKTKEKRKNTNDAFQLISVSDDIFIAWCQEESCLYTQTFQKLKYSSEESYKIQILKLSSPPIWNVKKIVSNQSGTGILLIGKEGVAVVELPKRWGAPALFEGGADTIICRVEYVGDQFFSCNTKVHITTADWHPGSIDYRSIIVLSSDNYLRIYSLPHVETPEQAIPVAQSLRISGEIGKIGVGEYAIDFGVGSPINQEQIETTKFKNIEEQLDEHKEKFYDLQWPVYILYNNGNVYYTITSLNHKKVKRKVLYGPMTMVPSSFDNYGLEFDNLLVLPCTPNVLVIGNSTGTLHHCIVMENFIKTESDTIEDIDILSQSMNNLNLETSNLCLHVYESVQLNLSVADKSSSDNLVKILLPDPNTLARYWVLHNEGIQGVTLPLVDNLLREGEDFPSYDLECHVEHFVCTRPLENLSHDPLLGLSVSTSPSTLFFLLGSGAVHTMPIPSLFFPNVNYLHSNINNSEAIPKKKTELFDEHIRSILQRSSSQPILLSGSSPNLSPEEYVALFTQVSDNLRQNYIQPHIKAKEAIERRSKILLDQRRHLQNEICSLQSDQQVMTEKAHLLAEKYEEANDKHMALMDRLEVVIGHLVKKIPLLSSAEKAMLKELEDMTTKRKTFSSELLQINSKYQWQQKQIEKQNKNESLVSQHQSSLTENQLKCLKMSLSKESEKLSTVVKKVNYMKKEVGL